MLSSANQVTDPPPLESLPPDGQFESTVCLMKTYVFFFLVLDPVFYITVNQGSWLLLFNQENKINDGSGPTLCFWDDGLTSLSIGGLLSEVSLKGNFGNHCKNSNATLWVDNLTNISIGGLFSESSLQEICKISHEQEPAQNDSSDQPSGSIGGILSEAPSIGEARFSDCKKTWERRRAIKQQPSSLISDSLDAFLVNQTDQPRAPCLAYPPPEPSHSSIFDAEDTCHAFSFRKGATTSLKVRDFFNTKHFWYYYCQKFRACKLMIM